MRFLPIAFSFLWVFFGMAPMDALNAKEYRVTPRPIKAESQSPDAFLRHVVTINRDWRFFLGDAAGGEAQGFKDSTWDRIGLPHSFSIPYFRSQDFYTGYGWYRRTLELSAPLIDGKSVFLEFDGVFQEAEVFVNGEKAGSHRGGYTGFAIDITKLVHPGSNILAIRVNNLWKPTLSPRAGEHVFSGGIYRNIRLVITDPLHVAWYGTWVTTPKVSGEGATVNVRTEVVNDSAEAKSCTVRTEIRDPDGKPVGRMESTLKMEGHSAMTFDQTGDPIVNPKLWDPEHPRLYTVGTTVLDAGKPVDAYTTPMGIRWFEWTADKGFFLNGKHRYFLGANVHQDHAGWGDAVTDAGAARDISLMKKAGFDFIRGSHYPHSPAFSEACDRNGMLFWSENCFWSTGGSKGNGYWDSSGYPLREEDEKAFEQSVRDSLRDMIRIHRNHPSIVVWSMGNEVFFTSPETLPKVRRFLGDLVSYCHELDPTRPAAIGGAQRGDLHKLGDIAGFNGDGAKIAAFINPGVPSVVSEYGSCCEDRPGSYDPNWGDLKEGPGLGKNLPYPWRYPWRSGEVIWCGFDHGSIAGSRFGGMGLMDYFRLPKRQWYWYRNEYRGVPPPEWPREGAAAGLKLEADKAIIQGTDATDDTHLTVTVLDKEGRPVSNSLPVTLSVESGPGEFPTGRSITFAPDSDIAIRDGKAAIEFRSYEGGKSLLLATSPGLKPASLTIVTKGAPGFDQGGTVPAKPRPYKRYEKASDPGAAARAVEFGMANPVAASGETPGHPATAANDGVKTTFWQSPDDQSTAWWQVNLERFVEASRIRLLFPNDAERRYLIEGSEDGVHWKTLVDRTTKPVTGRDRPEELPQGIQVLLVRVTFPGIRPGSPATLSEIGVSGRLAPRNSSPEKSQPSPTPTHSP